MLPELRILDQFSSRWTGVQLLCLGFEHMVSTLLDMFNIQQEVSVSGFKRGHRQSQHGLECLFLDTFVGGGIGEETGIMETAIKEAGEEANVPESLAAKVKPAGSVSLFFKNDRGILANTEYVFDLELPEDFVPSNNDGEVDSWVLVDVAEIPKLVCGDNFKTTSAAITIDWMIRKGFLTPETEPNYGDIIEMVHLPLTQLYRLYQSSIK